MPQIQSRSKRLNHKQLIQFGTEILKSAGLNEADAKLVADSLVESNLRGIDSHGLARLPHYLARIKGGSIDPKPVINVKELAPATSIVDGGNGLGQPVMWKASEEAIRLAKQSGAGWAAVNNSSHCGAMAYYGLKIAQAGMIGFAFTHVDPMVVPHGSSEPFCGTNPICITAPGLDNKMLCLDMSTSITPWNTIRNAAIEGVSIPSGWGVDENGNDTTDPNNVNAIHPFGEFKGSGLGILIDVLCSMLSGTPHAPDISKMYGDMTEHRSLGGLVGAIDISRFLPVETFQQRVSGMILALGALKPSEPNGRVMYPGEPEIICREERLSNGIPLGLGVIDELNLCGQEYGVAPLTDGTDKDAIDANE